MDLQKIRNIIAYFFAQEQFSDALRVTLSTLLPVSVLFYFEQPQAAIAVGLGSMSMSFTDSPGNISEKLRSFVVSLLLFSIIPFVITVSLISPWLTAVVVVMLTFILSLLNVYGNRFSFISTSSIILMIFVLGLKPVNVFNFTAFLLTGAVWYSLISLVQAKLWPFRSVQHAIGECMRSTANFIEAKAPFYDPAIAIKACYNQIIIRHAQVNEKQEHMRNILLKNEVAMGANNVKGQSFIKIASGVIDLYEQVTAIHYDYEWVRSALKSTGALELTAQMIKLTAQDLYAVSENLLSNKPWKQSLYFLNKMAQMKTRLDHIIENENDVNKEILKRLKVNIDEVFVQVQNIKTVLLSREPESDDSGTQPDYEHFFNRQEFSFKQIKAHLNIHSPIFRFSLRLAIACLFAFAITFIFPLGNYSYWILLTIVVIMKPGFSLTKTRNIQRLTGTLAGIAAGLILLAVVNVFVLQLTLSMIFLLGFFAFNKSNYTVSVAFITTMVILLLDIQSNHHTIYIFERILDTLIGCAIALSASYLFPVWEAHKLHTVIKEVLEVNINYLEKLLSRFSGQQVSVTSYKLSRKNVFIKLANLSTAIQNILLEPQKFNFNINDVNHFQMLIHQLYGTVASFFITNTNNKYEEEQLTLTTQAINNLKDCLQNLLDHHSISYKSLYFEEDADHFVDPTNHNFTNHQVQLLLSITIKLKKQFQAGH
ncbi:FUSC family membrane protein [Mucilaginibacter terrae]|uniref:FUSC family membrane protein n=1 Tax=Mucilaginibacter terrae TaxID=1955052 RepID=UPI003635E1F2